MDMHREVINSNECQFASIKSISQGNAETPRVSMVRQITLAIRRYLTPSQDRILHQQVNALIDRFYNLGGKKVYHREPGAHSQAEPLMAGDLVRVKSEEEIKATLNHLGQSRGCAFMADIMAPYWVPVYFVLITLGVVLWLM